MTEVLLAQRVTNLEEQMQDMIASVAEAGRQQALTQRELRLLSREMREWKEESMAQRQRSEQEMREWKEESAVARQRSEQEMREWKEESVAQRLRAEQEMREWKERAEAQRLRDQEEFQYWKQEWGKIARKLGTMAEDLVAPGVGRILRTVLGCPEDRVDSVAVRVRRRLPGSDSMREFDVVASCGQYVLINETKSTLWPEDVQRFANEIMPEVRQYFPEYADRQLIGAVASLYVDESLVRLGERLGLIVLGFGEDLMDVLNAPGFVPRYY